LDTGGFWFCSNGTGKPTSGCTAYTGAVRRLKRKHLARQATTLTNLIKAN
jgi:hypothetical protein